MGQGLLPQEPFARGYTPTDVETLEDADHLTWVLHELGMVADPSSPAVSPPQVVSLSGGADARTYLVRSAARDIVVKFSDHGLEAEATALRAWRAVTGAVPKVLAAGAVASTTRVKYLVIPALLNDDGEVVETAAQYLKRRPDHARVIGRALGSELHKLHQARCLTGFGNFGDSPGADRTYRNWGSYLNDFFIQHADHVRRLGVSERSIAGAAARIKATQFVKDARYLHGDVSTRNIAILGHDPMRIVLLDPNPVSGDPSWDIAPIVNKAQLDDRRHVADAEDPTWRKPDRDVLIGFWEGYPHVVTDTALLTAQLVHAVLQDEHRQRASAEGDTDELDVTVSHEFVRDLTERVSA